MASIFREQNLERVSNPDAPDDYVRVPVPGVGMAAAAVLLLVGAAVVWGLLGTVEVKARGYLVVDRGASTLWLPEAEAQALVPGSPLEAGGASGLVTSPAGEPEAAEEVVADAGDRSFETLGLWLCPLSASIALPEGTYDASVTLQHYTPWELVFGGAQADAGA